MATYEQIEAALARWRDARRQALHGSCQAELPSYSLVACTVAQALAPFESMNELVDAYHRHVGDAEAQAAADTTGKVLMPGVGVDLGYYRRYAQLARRARIAGHR
jgi:hypothetical protein